MPVITSNIDVPYSPHFILGRYGMQMKRQAILCSEIPPPALFLKGGGW